MEIDAGITEEVQLRMVLLRSEVGFTFCGGPGGRCNYHIPAARNADMDVDHP